MRNRRKLAAVTRETQEEPSRNGQSRNTSVPRINEEFMTQVSEEIEGRFDKKLSQEFRRTESRRTESRILGALFELDELLLNPLIRTHFGTVLAAFRNTNVENGERMRTTPGLVLILKQAFSEARLHKTLAQKFAMTRTYVEVKLG